MLMIFVFSPKNISQVLINKFLEKIQQTLSQSTVNESVVSPDDAVGKVLGKEYSGRPGDASDSNRSETH
uniref:Uncharacterized protein n=1 Tax=Solanum tuberosum TaxID=4113 RepID=M1DFV9_SOLTU